MAPHGAAGGRFGWGWGGGVEMGRSRTGCRRRRRPARSRPGWRRHPRWARTGAAPRRLPGCRETGLSKATISTLERFEPSCASQEDQSRRPSTPIRRPFARCCASDSARLPKSFTSKKFGLSTQLPDASCWRPLTARPSWSTGEPEGRCLSSGSRVQASDEHHPIDVTCHGLLLSIRTSVRSYSVALTEAAGGCVGFGRRTAMCRIAPSVILSTRLSSSSVAGSQSKVNRW